MRMVLYRIDIHLHGSLKVPERDLRRALEHVATAADQLGHGYVLANLAHTLDPPLFFSRAAAHQVIDLVQDAHSSGFTWTVVKTEVSE